MVNNPSVLYTVMGTSQTNTLADARLVAMPSALPVELQRLGVLVGRLIIGTNNAAITEVSSAYEITFNASTVISHNDTGNIQGGAVGDYQHVTTAEKANWDGKQNTLTNPVTGTGTTNFISKWTAAGVQGNSSITDNGTAVAIVTSDARLRGGDNAGRLILGNATTTSYLEFGGSTYTAPNEVSLITTTGNLNFFTNAISRIKVVNAGRVLFGATTDNGTDIAQLNGSAIATAWKVTGGLVTQYQTGTGTLVDFNTSVRGATLTGYVSGAGTVAATDNVLQAIQKLNGNNANAVLLTGNQSINGLKTFLSDTYFNTNIKLKDTGSSNYNQITAEGVGFRFNSAGYAFVMSQNSFSFGGGGAVGTISMANLNNTRTFDLPNQSGTFALTNNPTSITATAHVTTGGTVNQFVDGTGALQNISAVAGTLEFNATDLTVWNNGKGNIATNTSFGENALKANTSGTNNTSIGASSLRNTTTGLSNTAVGLSALESNITGHSNTAIGGRALQFHTSNNNNIAIGENAGSTTSIATQNTTGSSSVFIGVSTFPLNNNETNQIVIGTSAIGAGSNTATLGNANITKTILGGVIQKRDLDATPATATSTGTLGEIRVTATHIYVCTATNTWVRSALTTW
jgi:hypothetical protein